jgi:VWFA-related protein
MYPMSKCGVNKKLSKHQSSIVKLLASIAIVLPVLLACGQTAQLPASQAADSTVNIEKVSLDLLANYKNHKPVLDLKPEEIAIADDNSPVKLDSLHLVSGKQDSDRLITLVFDRAGSIVDPGQILDPSMARETRDAAVKILKMIPGSGFTISVLDVEGRLRLQSGFTSDRIVLTQALITAIKPDKSGGGAIVNVPEKQLLAELQTGNDSSGKPVSPGDRARDQALFSALSHSGSIVQDQHMRPTFAGLLALVETMQQIPHRKTVIYFASFKKTQIDSQARDAIKSIIGSANRAGVSIDVVDLTSFERPVTQLLGYNAGTALFAAPETHENETIKESESVEILDHGGILAHVYKDTSDDLRDLAEGTGGSYITEDRIQESIKRMIQDMSTYYEASYLPPIKEYDGKFHSIAVKSLRPSLKMRYQTGYLAMPPHPVAGDSTQPFELPLKKILNEAQLPGDLNFRAAILRMEDRPNGNVNTLAIEVPLSSLEIHKDSSTNLYSAHLSILATIKDKAGAVVDHFSADIPRRGALKDGEINKFEAISMDRSFTAAPGQYLLEAAILDQNSGKTGAQRMTFEIPNASAAPSLSEIVLVRQTTPFGADGDPSEPLRNGSDKVTPNLSGQLAPGAKGVSVFFIAHADQHATETATLKLQVLKDGKPLGGEPLTAKQTDGSEFSSYLNRFTFDALTDGQYEVKVILSQGGKTAQASTMFALAGFNTEAADADLPALDTVAHPAGPLVISFPENPIQAPPPDELQSILADAGVFAMNYGSSLPNFICKQITNRSVDPSSSTNWKHKDKLTERLTYLDHKESRTLLEVEDNGHKSDIYRDDSPGMISAGEFGVVLSGLFRPESKADFKWAKTGMLGDEKVQVFDYRVARENSTFNLRIGTNLVISVAYHGQVIIDSATRNVRRITQVADDVPAKYPIHGASVSVDYDYVMINNHDYLLPIGAEIMLRKGRRETDLNEIEFRNFHRFGSTVRILDPSPGEKP